MIKINFALGMINLIFGALLTSTFHYCIAGLCFVVAYMMYKQESIDD